MRRRANEFGSGKYGPKILKRITKGVQDEKPHEDEMRITSTAMLRHVLSNCASISTAASTRGDFIHHASRSTLARSRRMAICGLSPKVVLAGAIPTTVGPVIRSSSYISGVRNGVGDVLCRFGITASRSAFTSATVCRATPTRSSVGTAKTVYVALKEVTSIRI